MQSSKDKKSSMMDIEDSLSLSPIGLTQSVPTITAA